MARLVLGDRLADPPEPPRLLRLQISLAAWERGLAVAPLGLQLLGVPEQVTVTSLTSRYITSSRYITLLPSRYITSRYITSHYVTSRPVTRFKVRGTTLHHVTLRHVTSRYQVPGSRYLLR